MRTSPVLPGVDGPESTHRRAIPGHAATILRARRRAAFQDLADAAILVLIDVAFVSWGDARLPFLSRDVTLDLLLLAHVAFLGAFVAVRLWPQWRARSVAATWSRTERERFRA